MSKNSKPKHYGAFIHFTTCLESVNEDSPRQFLSEAPIPVVHHGIEGVTSPETLWATLRSFIKDRELPWQMDLRDYAYPPQLSFSCRAKSQYFANSPPCSTILTACLPSHEMLSCGLFLAK